MRPPAEIWRQRLWVWLPAALFFLVNATAFAVYRFGYADRVAGLRDELKSQRAAEKSEEAKRRQHEGLLQLATINRQRIEQLYSESFSTRRRRLTGVTAEVISLAGKAGLAPRALNYPEQEIQGYNLIKRSFIFSVDGTYLDLRKFINLLELSDSFLTLEGVSLSEGGARRAGPEVQAPPGAPAAARGAAASGSSSELHISLRLSTLFAKDDANPLATPADSARAGRGR
jgi:type IV pilus assembly protein PilO